jgi:hypothetical protein
VKKKKKAMMQKMKSMGPTASINDTELLQLKEILVNDDPHLYLDEIALRFAVATGKYLDDATIWKYMSKKLD